jgi:hypothetical protein
VHDFDPHDPENKTIEKELIGPLHVPWLPYEEGTDRAPLSYCLHKKPDIWDERFGDENEKQFSEGKGLDHMEGKGTPIKMDSTHRLFRLHKIFESNSKFEYIGEGDEADEKEKIKRALLKLTNVKPRRKRLQRIKAEVETWDEMVQLRTSTLNYFEFWFVVASFFAFVIHIAFVYADAYNSEDSSNYVYFVEGNRDQNTTESAFPF